MLQCRYGSINVRVEAIQSAVAQYYRISLTDLKSATRIISIDSTLGEGTTIRLSIPLISAPKWLALQIELRNAKKVVVLEDDPGMVLLWKQRLGEGNSFETFYFSQPEQFDASLFPPEQTCYSSFVNHWRTDQPKFCAFVYP